MEMICEYAVISWYSYSVFGFDLKEFLGFLGEFFRDVKQKRWFPDGHGPIISLPFKHSDEFIGRFEAKAKLKAKASAESGPPKSLPSSLYLLFSGAPLLERVVSHLIKEPAAGMVYKEAYATINQLWL